MDIVWQDLTTATLPGGAYHLKNRLPRAQTPASGGSPYRYSLPDLTHVEQQSLLHALAKTLAFPDYFGMNWDAAYDCLTDREWTSGAVVVIEMHITAGAIVDEGALTTLVELMRDACQFWKEQKVTLYFLLTCPRHDLTSLNSLSVLRLV